MATFSLLLVTAIWGWTFVLVKDAVGEVGPFWFLAVRFFLASLFALPFWPRRKSSWRPAALLGVFLFAGYFFQTWGLRYTTAQKSGLITGFSVVLVPVFARLLGERVRLGGWAGVVLATAGVALLALAGNEPLGPTSFGDFLTVLCAISFALYIALLARYAKGEKASALLFGQLSMVFLLSLLGAAAFGEVRWPISGKVWVSSHHRDLCLRFGLLRFGLGGGPRWRHEDGGDFGHGAGFRRLFRVAPFGRDPCSLADSWSGFGRWGNCFGERC